MAFCINFNLAGKQVPQCYPSSVTSARTMMLFNLGSAYCLRSEYDKARKCLHQVNKMVSYLILGKTVKIWPTAILKQDIESPLLFSLEQYLILTSWKAGPFPQPWKLSILCRFLQICVVLGASPRDQTKEILL